MMIWLFALYILIGIMLYLINEYCLDKRNDSGLLKRNLFILGWLPYLIYIIITYFFFGDW